MPPCHPGCQPRQGWCPAHHQSAPAARHRCSATARRSPPANSLAIVNEDLQYLHQHAGKELETVKEAHDLVAGYLNPLLGEQKEQEIAEQVDALQATLQSAHQQVHQSESLLEQSVTRLSALERSAAKFRFTAEGPQPQASSSSSSSSTSSSPSHCQQQPPLCLAQDQPRLQPVPVQQPQIQESSQPPTQQQAAEGRTLGAGTDLPPNLQNFWFPAEFSSRLRPGQLVPLQLFEQPWVLFRDTQGQACCIRDTCAHRACPLSLGSMCKGEVQCPYHGWTYNGAGQCTGMPSTRMQPGISVPALPVSEAGGFVWVWPGSETPSALVPDSVLPPPGFQVHAELQLEVPVDHGLLVENLLDLAHAPFTHTTTFAKGWPVPDVVKFQAQQLLAGHWEPYPIDMSFEPPCMVLSTIGLAQPGKIMRGVRAAHCENHLHQLHVCLPAGPGRTRLLYRMSMDFLAWTRHVPLIQRFWSQIAGQVLGEDLVLVKGQQERMGAGADVWANPVAYDKLGVRYRRWRNSLVLPKSAPARQAAEEELATTMSAGAIFATQETEDIHTEQRPAEERAVVESS